MARVLIRQFFDDRSTLLEMGMPAKLNEASRLAAEDCAQRSRVGAIDFGSVVRALGEAGIESYFTDYRRGEIHVERFPS